VVKRKREGNKKKRGSCLGKFFRSKKIRPVEKERQIKQKETRGGLLGGNWERENFRKGKKVSLHEKKGGTLEEHKRKKGRAKLLPFESGADWLERRNRYGLIG